MDLALEFGMPVAWLKRVMTERELRQWMKYATRRMLPGRRVELYLAQIAMMVRQTADSKTRYRLEQFMFDPPEDEPDEDKDDLEQAIDFFEFAPDKD
jgi:hypothetical protein